MKKSHAQQACFHPVIGQLLFVGGFSSHQLSPIHLYQALGAKRKVEISSIFHLSGILFVLSYSSHLFPSSASCLVFCASLPLLFSSLHLIFLCWILPCPQNSTGIKSYGFVAYQSDYHISPPLHKSLGRTWVHQIQYQTPKFSSHPYQSSCLFLKIWQCYIIIMLCRSEAAVHQDEWNKSQSWVSARSVIWKLCLFS